MSEYERGKWDMFCLISSVWYGKQCYFLEPNGVVYSRETGMHMTRDDAIADFLSKIGDD